MARVPISCAYPVDDSGRVAAVFFRPLLDRADDGLGRPELGRTAQFVPRVFTVSAGVEPVMRRSSASSRMRR